MAETRIPGPVNQEECSGHEEETTLVLVLRPSYTKDDSRCAAHGRSNPQL